MGTVSTEYRVVSDKLRYGLRPKSVESKCHSILCPALGINLYEGTTASSIVFRIQHNPSGRFVDPTTCKFKMQFTHTVQQKYNLVTVSSSNVDRNPSFAVYK